MLIAAPTLIGPSRPPSDPFVPEELDWHSQGTALAIATDFRGLV